MAKPIRKEAFYPHPPNKVWVALTDRRALAEWLMPNDFEARVGHKFRFQVDPMPGCGHLTMCEVLEVDPPRKLVQTWHPLWDESVVAEAPTRLTYDIEEDDDGYTRLTVTHELEGAPFTAGAVVPGPARLHEGGGGWPWILSSLKTLLETGKV